MCPKSFITFLYFEHSLSGYKIFTPMSREKLLHISVVLLREQVKIPKNEKHTRIMFLYFHLRGI